MEARSKLFRWLLSIPHKTVRKLGVTCLKAAFYATLIYVLFWRFGPYLAISNAAEQAQDAQMKFQAGRFKPTETEHHFVLVDFDADTLASWDDPALIPVPKIVAALHNLAETAPWAIFVDLDLSYLQPSHELDALMEELQALDQKGIPVFLQRELLDGFGQHKPHFRVTPLSSLVAKSANLAWFSALSIPSAQGVERHAPYLVSGTVGLDRAQSESIPSAALAALLLSDQDHNQKAAKDLFAEAVANPQGACPAPNLAAADAICFCGRKPFALTPSQQTIHYAVLWKSTRSLIRPLSAKKLFDGQDAGLAIGPNAFEGSIVVLGSSAPDRGDLHQTSLGEIPGSVILINMIRAWLVDGPEKAPNFFGGLLLVLALSTTLAALTFFIYKYVPQRWHGHANPVLAHAVAWLPLMIFLLFGPSANAGWLLALQGINTRLVTSPVQAPSPFLALSKTLARKILAVFGRTSKWLR